MSYTNRKPYLGLKNSIIELYKRPVRFLSESLEKESQFEKPYGDDMEYQLMHLDIPAPDWPTFTWSPDPDPFPPGGGGIGKPIGRCGYCAIYVDPITDCEKEAVEVHSARFCTHTPMAAGALSKRTTRTKHPEYPAGDPRFLTTEQEVNGSTAGDTTLRVWVSPGKIKEITAGMWAFLGPSVAVWLDPSVEKHTVLAEMIDGEGNRCYANVDVVCGCQCPGVTMAWTAATKTNTGRFAKKASDSGGPDPAEIEFTGGCPPFTWTKTALGAKDGWTLSPSGLSDSRSATVSLADGTCGTNFDVSTKITVEDKCGEILTHHVHWYYSSLNLDNGCSTTACTEVNPLLSVSYSDDGYCYQYWYCWKSDASGPSACGISACNPGVKCTGRVSSITRVGACPLSSDPCSTFNTERGCLREARFNTFGCT